MGLMSQIYSSYPGPALRWALGPGVFKGAVVAIVGQREWS